jgi:hypothetical protein
MGPTRLLDARSPASPLAVCPGRPQNTCTNQVSTAETLQVTGQLGVPVSGVDSVVLNVTVVSPSAVGHLIVYPTAATPPNGDLSAQPSDRKA